MCFCKKKKPAKGERVSIGNIGSAKKSGKPGTFIDLEKGDDFISIEDQAPHNVNSS